MTNLINRILAKFNLKLEYINQKPDTRLVEASVRFMDTIPKSILPNSCLGSSYVGDINYIQRKVNGEFPQVSGETYYKSASEKYFCDYNGDENAPFEKMYETTTFTEQKLQNKLNDTRTNGSDLQILTDDKETFYRISYTDEIKYVSWFRREYGILYPVETKLYDILTQKHFEVSND